MARQERGVLYKYTTNPTFYLTYNSPELAPVALPRDVDTLAAPVQRRSRISIDHLTQHACLGNGQTKLTFIGNEPMESAKNSGQLEGWNQILDKVAAVVEGLAQAK